MVRSAPPDHRFDMKMLLLLTKICKCSFSSRFIKPIWQDCLA